MGSRAHLVVLMRVRLALVQMRITSDIGANLESISAYASRAKRARADVVVFPEICVTGNLKINPKRDGGGVYLKHFAGLAKREGLDIVAGSIIEPSRGGRMRNVSYYIDRRGRTLARYAKRNLWKSEMRSIAAGSSAAVARTRFGKIGILVCWDIMRPEFFAELAARGVSIVACPSYWWKAGIYGVDGRLMDSILKTRCFENGVIVAYCNAAGSSRGRLLLGRSQVVSPVTLRRRALGHNREGMLVADVDTGSAGRAAKIYRLRGG